MVLSDIGEIVNTEWLKTFEMRSEMNLYMGEYVIMPNHFHAIIDIGENKYNTNRDLIDTNIPQGLNGQQGKDIAHYQTKNKFGPQSKNLSSNIRGFKIGVTKNVHIIKGFRMANTISRPYYSKR